MLKILHVCTQYNERNISLIFTSVIIYKNCVKIKKNLELGFFTRTQFQVIVQDNVYACPSHEKLLYKYAAKCYSDKVLARLKI